MTRVLVVDDDKSIRLFMRALLEREGYAVEVVEDAACAREAMPAGAFDIVVADITLPGMSGVELMQELRQAYPRVPVILMTGMPTVETAAEAVRAGAYDYLTKPIERAAILRVVGGAARVKALDDERAALMEQNRKYAEELEQMVRERTEKLRQSESRYRRLFETAQDGLMILEGETGQVVDVNPYLVELLGCPREYFLKQKLWEIELFRDTALSRTSLAEVLAGGHVCCEDLPLTTLDGRHIELEFVSYAYETGGQTAIQCNVRDVTGRNTVLNRLRNLNEMQAKFVAEASHEVRTPLTIVKESVLQVLEGLCGDLTDAQRDTLTLGMQGIERLNAVVDDLLDISRLESGKMVLRREPVELGKLLEEVRVLFAPQMQAKGLSCEVVAPPPAIEISVDRGRLLQVLTNLVGNALKFTPQGTIRLTAADRGDHVECAVADTGVGIAEADLPRAFGRFLQFGKPWTGPAGGTGLGLSIAKSLVELHGGKIRVQSAVHRGTTFTFILPRLGREQLLNDQIEAALAEVRRQGRELLLVWVRLTDAGAGADAAGGPDALDQLADAVRARGFSAARGKDGLAVFAETDGYRAAETAETLRACIKRFFFELQSPAAFRYEFGLSAYPRDGENAQEMLARADAALAAEREAKASRCILVVDDEPEAIRMVREILFRQGYGNVAAAEDGLKALAHMAGEVPALILLDIHMPRLNGHEFIGRLKHDGRTARVPLLITSGSSGEPGRPEREGDSAVIPTVRKPFRPGEIEKWVRFLM